MSGWLLLLSSVRFRFDWRVVGRTCFCTASCVPTGSQLVWLLLLLMSRAFMRDTSQCVPALVSSSLYTLCTVQLKINDKL